MFLSSKIKENEVQNYSLQKSFGALFVLAAMFFSGTAAAQVTQVLVNTGRPDGKLGALSRPASANKPETETADDFVLSQTTVSTTGVNKINAKPLDSVTHGEPAAIGEEVEIAITFTSPIVLPAGHYFFRPEVLVTGGDFLYLSAPRPIVAPGTAIAGDLQAWIRKSGLTH